MTNKELMNELKDIKKFYKDMHINTVMIDKVIEDVEIRILIAEYRIDLPWLNMCIDRHPKDYAAIKKEYMLGDSENAIPVNVIRKIEPWLKRQLKKH